MNLRFVGFILFFSPFGFQSYFPSIFSQVNIQVPAPELQSNKIAITGLATHLDRAKEGLLERVKELQAEQQNRVGIWVLLILNTLVYHKLCVELF